MKTITWFAIALVVGYGALIAYRVANDRTPCNSSAPGYCQGAAVRRAILGSPAKNFQQCIDDYATPARTELGARAAVAACTRLRDATGDANRKWATCVLKTVPGAGSELGVKLAMRACNSGSR